MNLVKILFLNPHLILIFLCRICEKFFKARRVKNLKIIIGGDEAYILSYLHSLIQADRKEKIIATSGRKTEFVHFSPLGFFLLEQIKNIFPQVREMRRFFVDYIKQDSIGSISNAFLVNSDLYGITSEVMFYYLKKKKI